MATKYYNEMLGDTSFILAGLLESHLNGEFDDWDKEKWMDDCLITNAEIDEGELSLSGVMIWGIESVTAQWTAPFFFKIELDEDRKDYFKYAFLFGDLDLPEIPYEYFRQNRNCWNSFERNWKYIINSSRKMN